MSGPEPAGEESLIRFDQAQTDGSRRVEGVTKPKLLADYVSMVGFNFLSISMSFVNTSIILSLLGRADYGEIVSATSMSLIVGLITTEWSAQAAIRYGTAEFLDTGRVTAIFWNRLFIAACCLCVALPILMVGFRYLGPYLGFTRLTLVFLMIHLPAAIYWLHIQRFLPVIGWQRMLYPFLFLERFVLLSVVGTCHFLNRLTIPNVLTGYVLGSVSAGIVSTLLIHGQIGRPQRPLREKVILMLRFSWPLIPTVWIGALSTNALDYLFIRRYVGTAQLGVYSLGVQIAGTVQQLPQIAGTLAMPRIIALRLNQDRARLERFVQREFIFVQWLWISMCFVGAAAFAWQGPKYVPANYMLLTELVWPLAIVTSLLPIWYIVLNPLLTAFERTRTIMWASMTAGLINLSANMILIPRFGATGSAWATVLSFWTPPLMVELLLRRTESREIPRRGLTFYMPAIVMTIAGLSACAL